MTAILYFTGQDNNKIIGAAALVMHHSSTVEQDTVHRTRDRSGLRYQGASILVSRCVVQNLSASIRVSSCAVPIRVSRCAVPNLSVAAVTVLADQAQSVAPSQSVTVPRSQSAAQCHGPTVSHHAGTPTRLRVSISESDSAVQKQSGSIGRPRAQSVSSSQFHRSYQLLKQCFNM